MFSATRMQDKTIAIALPLAFKIVANKKIMFITLKPEISASMTFVMRGQVQQDAASKKITLRLSGDYSWDKYPKWTFFNLRKFADAQIRPILAQKLKEAEGKVAAILASFQ